MIWFYLVFFESNWNPNLPKNGPLILYDYPYLKLLWLKENLKKVLCGTI